MVTGITKRIVVIKNIPSNIIEEAILILKRDPGNGFEVNNKGVLNGMQNKNNDFLLKEAEFIIKNYIKENKLQEGRDRRVDQKLKFFKDKLSTNLAINLALIGSIVFLLFVVLKLI